MYVGAYFLPEISISPAYAQIPASESNLPEIFVSLTIQLSILVSDIVIATIAETIFSFLELVEINLAPSL